MIATVKPCTPPALRQSKKGVVPLVLQDCLYVSSKSQMNYIFPTLCPLL